MHADRPEESPGEFGEHPERSSEEVIREIEEKLDENARKQLEIMASVDNADVLALRAEVANLSRQLDAFSSEMRLRGDDLLESLRANRTELPHGSGVSDPEFPEPLNQISQKLNELSARFLRTTYGRLTWRCLKLLFGFTRSVLNDASSAITVYQFYVANTQSSALFANIERAQNLAKSDPMDMDSIRKILKSWQDIPEHDFWKIFSGYIKDSNDLTISDQTVFLQIIMQLSPIRPMLWDSNQDRLNIVGELVEFYKNKASCISDIFLEIAQKTYQGQPLSRANAANLLILALGEILVLELPIKRPVPAKAQAAVVRAMVMTQGGGDHKAAFGEMLSIASTLSWAIPYAGPFVSAGIQLVTMIFGLGGGSAIDFTPVFKALEKLQENLIHFFTDYTDHVQLQANIDLIQSYVTWVALNFGETGVLTIAEAQNDLQGAIDKITMRDSGCLDVLSRTSSPENGTLHSVIVKILKDADLNPLPNGYRDRQHYAIAKDKYETLLSAMTLHLSALKNRILLIQFVKRNRTTEELRAALVPDDIVNESAAFLDYESRLGYYTKLASLVKVNPADPVDPVAPIIYQNYLNSIRVSTYSDNCGPTLANIRVLSIAPSRTPYFHDGTRDGNNYYMGQVTKDTPGGTFYYLYTTDYFVQRYNLQTGTLYSVAKDYGWMYMNEGYCGGFIIYVNDEEREHPGPFPDTVSWVPGDLEIHPEFYCAYRKKPHWQWRPERHDSQQSREAIKQKYIASLPSFRDDFSISTDVLTRWNNSKGDAFFGIKVNVPTHVGWKINTAAMVTAAPGTPWCEPNMKVRYGLKYLRASSPDSDLIWTPWIPTDGKKNPTLPIPDIGPEIVGCIWIYRQFGTASEGVDPSGSNLQHFRLIKTYGVEDKVNGKFPGTYLDAEESPKAILSMASASSLPLTPEIVKSTHRRMLLGSSVPRLSSTSSSESEDESKQKRESTKFGIGNNNNLRESDDGGRDDVERRGGPGFN